MSLAQQEFNQLVSEKPNHRRHPEDQQQQDSDSDSVPPGDNPDNNNVYEDGNDNYGEDENDDDDFDDEAYDTMIAKSTYHVPSTVFAANTGPKGVIADAQSYERAKKKSFRRTLMSAAGFDRSSPPAAASSEKVPALTQIPPDETEDERFMRQWREVRMRELAEKQNQVALRGAGPGGRKKYGSVEIVSANAYLDAVEDAAPGAVVVVCIYDPESAESSIVEDSLLTVARKHAAVRFIKLHHEIADMEHLNAPALLAYRNGDVFSTLVDIFTQLPNGRDCSSASLEELLMQHRVL